jgi:hypothetical protein
MSLHTAVARPVKLHQQLCVICFELAHIRNSVTVCTMLLAAKYWYHIKSYAAVLLDRLGIVNNNFRMGH